MRYFLLILQIFCFQLSSVSQAHYGYRQGLIVKKDGEKIHCFIALDFTYDSLVYYKLDESYEASSLKITEIKRLELPEKYFENIETPQRQRLMLEIVKGKMSLYKYLEIKDSVIVPGPGATAKMSKFIDHYFIKKNNDCKEITEPEFKETVSSFMSDCSELSSKINDGIYTYRDIEKIVREYNKCRRK